MFRAIRKKKNEISIDEAKDLLRSFVEAFWLLTATKDIHTLYP